jgi:mycothiol synthase
VTLRVEPVTPSNAAQLVQYCAKHGAEHDASYLPGAHFTVTPKQPSHLLLSDASVVGVASLMLTPRYTSVGTGRFAILHSTMKTAEAYACLYAAVQPHTRGLRNVYLFLPEKVQDTAAILHGLGFRIERYSYALRKAPAVSGDIVWPEGVAVEALDSENAVGAQQFADCLNDSFAALAGHADVSAGDVRSWFDEQEHLDGGICLLKQDGRPIGTVMVMTDGEDPAQAEVGALGIVGVLQGRGLGRLLLRYAVGFAVQNRFGSVVLSVNAENESALRLYQSEGFSVIETMVCYAKDCSQDFRQASLEAAL